MNAAERHLVVFARRPQLKRGKRRLAREIGDLEAWRFQRWALARLTRTLSKDPRWRFWQALTPDIPAVRRPLGELSQGEGDLGRRLATAIAQAPAGDIVIIGSDTPQISARDIARAFKRLGNVDVVLGPARDGGFWLIGFTRRARGTLPFDNVRWSSAQTLADVLHNLSGVRVAMLDVREDVDDAASLKRVRALMRRAAT